MKTNITKLEQTEQLAVRLAGKVEKSDVIELTGDLGAGKTTFAQFFIRFLTNSNEEIISPTFNIVHPYEADICTIFHFDLYRLKDINEAEEIGIYDAFDEGICLIEWPQIISSIVPENRLLINLTEKDGQRFADVQGLGTWKEKLSNILLNDGLEDE